MELRLTRGTLVQNQQQHEPNHYTTLHYSTHTHTHTATVLLHCLLPKKCICQILKDLYILAEACIIKAYFSCTKSSLFKSLCTLFIGES